MVVVVVVVVIAAAALKVLAVPVAVLVVVLVMAAAAAAMVAGPATVAIRQRCNALRRPTTCKQWHSRDPCSARVGRRLAQILILTVVVGLPAAVGRVSVAAVVVAVVVVVVVEAVVMVVGWRGDASAVSSWVVR